MNQVSIPNPKVTLADIAEASGVSPATVSLVLRDKPGASPETRQRILENAQRLGYLVKPPSLGQAQQALNTIGVIIRTRPSETLLINNFYTYVLTGIETSCRQRQISLLYSTIVVDQGNRPLELPPLLTQEQGPDGLILVGALVNGALREVMLRSSTPLVLVDAYAAGDPYDVVVSANVEGAYRAVTYLIENGHRHIGLVGSHPDAYPSIQERRRGYLQALAEHGLQPYFADSPLNPEQAGPATAELLRHNPQVSALFGCNDDVAIAAIQAARDMGRQVPAELSVSGFDDIVLAQHANPPLTTMSVDKIGMGRLAVQLLINRYEYPEAGKVRVTTCPLLVERQSVQRLDQ